MKRLLSFLLDGCWHRWKIVARDNVWIVGEDGNRQTVAPNLTAYTLKCEHCGKMKTFTADFFD